ncbi:MAG: AAA family ATPase [Deltaproteobacteria bacterium]|nr:AAA family ATPase [Deltaproteobacteria bacterium]
MDFYAVLDQVVALLQHRSRVTYRALKLQFQLDDEQLDALKDELLFSHPEIVDETGRGLVWTGVAPVLSPESRVLSPLQSPAPSTQSPSSYTPAHLAERIRAASLTEGERKTITALFADLKGSTALIEGLDPEEARAIIDPALQLMMDAVHRYEGYVAQALGDGIFALFGAPIAHEDHPQRALYAALRMQDEMRRYADQVRLQHGAPLAMRVGVNTGEVVVRSIRKDDLHTDYVPVGHSTNLAARMEQMATPGSILITEYTRKLVEGYFELKGLGAATIKGVEAPLAVYEVLGAGPLRTRLQVAARRGLTRFVGRQRELEQLQRALDQAKAGQGQIVGTMGEPGLGKSRLFYEFKLLSQSGCLVLEAYSVSHGKASPYLPVMELLKSYFDIQTPDDERKRREKIGGKVLMLDRSLEETLPYLFALLGVEEQPSPLQQMDPQIRRRRTFEALKKLFLRESLNQPLILIFEDLHWIDSETQGFLDTVSEGVASARILLLVNYRPEYRHEWGSKTYYTQLRLAPLRREEAEEFLDVLLGLEVGAARRGRPSEGAHTGAPLQDLKQLILEKTQGTPFFMEEIVQELVEQGVLVRAGVETRCSASLPTDLHLPPTVQAILAARIDRLAPDEKALLQQLAVIGREFPLSLVRQVIPQPEDELYRLLSVLQHKEFLYEQPAFPEVEYFFKHALTQEVAYGSLLLERRKALHEQTGQAIEQLFHAQLDEYYRELAHHYSRSGNTEKAIEYLHKAGQQAVQQSAYEDAIVHLNAAIALSKVLPDATARIQQELLLQIALGVPLQALRGYGSTEAGVAYTRARELCEKVGEEADLFPILAGLRLFSTVRGDLLAARQIGEQLVQLADHSKNTEREIEACYALAVPLTWMGKFSQAWEYIERGLAGSASQIPSTHSRVSVGGRDLAAPCLAYAAWALWFLGYPNQALSYNQKLLALLPELASTFWTASVIGGRALFYQLRREVMQTQEAAEVALSLTTTYGFSQIKATAAVLQGWGLVQQGQPTEGLAQMRRALVDMESTGTVLWKTYFLALHGEALAESGQYADGLAVLSAALGVAEQNEERFYEAEIYRLKGMLTLQSQVEGHKSKVEEAEACFLKAIDIARSQSAKSLELRATVSLARLWRQQGKTAEAHTMLADIYNWFTEGFDTVDLKEAKALLEELCTTGTEEQND